MYLPPAGCVVDIGFFSILHLLSLLPSAKITAKHAHPQVRPLSTEVSATWPVTVCDTASLVLTTFPRWLPTFSDPGRSPAARDLDSTEPRLQIQRGSERN